MEKQTPNDADDAGPFGQYHQHHWGPVSPFSRCLGRLCPLGKHETGLARVAQAKPHKMCMLHVFAHTSGIFVVPKLVQCVKCGCYWQLICPRKMQLWARTWSACTENRV